MLIFYFFPPQNTNSLNLSSKNMNQDLDLVDQNKNQGGKKGDQTNNQKNQQDKKKQKGCCILI